ncbi:hypothetical protein [Agriterribacter sp.]|uniref:hypothetical protein n=1 Tax=Agriterribacter sp. TaxID=2821509 RepID=UPI002CCDE766|nr:hypothetical protein [Agriterribacter sp.]HRP54852.1 hypothetical protein [Agriterribacter sp.]
MKRQFYIPALVLLIFSCTKDGEIRRDVSGAKLQFVKVNGGDIIQEENIYNESGNIKTRISYKDYAAGLIFSKTTYTYERDELIQTDDQVDFSSSTFSTQYQYSRSRFEYSGNRIIQRNHYLKTGDDYELRSFTVFSYDDPGRPVKQTRYSADGELLGYTIYTYKGNNVAQSEAYSINQSNAEPVPAFKYSYKYDNKKNPYREVYHSIENIPFSVNENNITETISVNYNIYPLSAQGVSSTSQTTYVYNSLGYPSLMNENGNEFILEYK